MKKTFLLLFFTITSFISFAQCIEKHITETSNTTAYLNAKSQPTKIITVNKGKKETFNFKYDAKGNCIFIGSGSTKFNIKGAYNDRNQLSSTVCKLEDFIITNTFEYIGDEITKITTSAVMSEVINFANFETMLTYENGNIVKMDVLNKSELIDTTQNALQTVISGVTYDTNKASTSKEETMASLAFYMGNNMNTSLLELSRNNPLKFSYLKLTPDEDCEEKTAEITNEYQYDAKNRVIKVTKKETCGGNTTTTNTKIERTCK